MKKLLAGLFLSVLVLALAACGAGKNNPANNFFILLHSFNLV